ncbi:MULTISPECIES: hypothetical protein [Bacillus]|uniref:hypothetical protein n=1 Tax=Bacillus TaxID=1386 RepID=UPI001BEB8F37|nr:hypothetical protein [Bacillus safensis]MBT2261569.1 hypothetical protein [Bacillus safensis]
MDYQFKKIVDMKKDDVKEHVYTNINFLIRHYRWSKNKDFFESISEKTGIPYRTISSWYYKEKLPELHRAEITMLTSSLKVHFSDFVSTHITEDSILSQSPDIFIPSNVAKQNILKLLIDHDIQNPDKFESFFESNYSSNYFYVLQRKRNHQRNLSWTFIVTAAHYFNISVGDLFKNEGD